MTKKLQESEKQKEEIKNFKKEENRINNKIGEQLEAENRFGGAVTYKKRAAPEQLQPT